MMPRDLVIEIRPTRRGGWIAIEGTGGNSPHGEFHKRSQAILQARVMAAYRKPCVFHYFNSAGILEDVEHVEEKISSNGNRKGVKKNHGRK